MSSSEFEQRLGAEPRETAEAWRSDPNADSSRAEAVAAAERFEDSLEGALRLPVDESSLLEDILAVPSGAGRRSGPPRWLAMAASVVLVVGIAGVAWWSQQSGEPNLERYVAGHYRHDGAEVLARRSEGADAAQVASVLASLGATASADLAAQVQFIKFCPTPDSRGAHMVLATDAGPVTVIFMPAVRVDEPTVIRFDGVNAQVIGLTSGAAAIIGADDGAAQALQATLEAGLRPTGADA